MAAVGHALAPGNVERALNELYAMAAHALRVDRGVLTGLDPRAIADFQARLIGASGPPRTGAPVAPGPGVAGGGGPPSGMCGPPVPGGGCGAGCATNSMDGAGAGGLWKSGIQKSTIK